MKFRANVTRAFTLIELLIVVIVMAVLSTALLVTIQRGIIKARYDNQVTQITALIEKARGYALSNYLVNDSEPAEYYHLNVQTSKIEIIAVDENGATETLETITYEDGFEMSISISLYYFPPDGTVCFSTTCSDGTTTYKWFTFRDIERTHQTRLTITKYGGYPEVEEL